MQNKMVVERYKFGPVRDGNHQDFVLVEKDDHGAHFTIYKYIGYREHALYEVRDSVFASHSAIQSCTWESFIQWSIRFLNASCLG